MYVYVLGCYEADDEEEDGVYTFGVRKVDYFHGMYDGVAICQMWDNEDNVLATAMINISKGYTAQRIIHLQRRWR